MNAIHHTAPQGLHGPFVALLLPRIERYGRVYFRHLRPEREEAVAEMVALGWKWHLRLAARGKDPTQFAATFACFAARAVRGGRRLCGQEQGKDALSTVAQKRHGFHVEHLPTSTATPPESRYSSIHGQHTQDVFEERLRDNSQTPVPDQVCFRIDFPGWLATLTPRERRLVREMAHNERTLDLSKRFELSPGRISQMRRELHSAWTKFNGDGLTAA